MTSHHPTAAGIQDAARHLAEERTDEAVAVLEHLVGDFPSYVTAYVLLAKAYEVSGRTADALEAWHRAYFLMPGSPLIVRERSRLLGSALVAEPGEGTREDNTSDGPGVAFEPVSALLDDDAEEASAHSRGPVPGVGMTTEGLLEEADDLDTLIEQLENAPRLQPNPAFRDDAPDEDDDEEDEMVSETLARIYESQKEYGAAARAYERLATEHPDRADEWEEKAAEMRQLEAHSRG